MNGCQKDVMNVYSVAKTIGGTCKEINQLTEVVDYNEDLGFTSRGQDAIVQQSIFDFDAEIANNDNLAFGMC